MIKGFIRSKNASEYQEMLEEELQQIPDQEDLDQAASGIISLQEMYKLHPWSITTDHLTGQPNPNP